MNYRTALLIFTAACSNAGANDKLPASDETAQPAAGSEGKQEAGGVSSPGAGSQYILQDADRQRTPNELGRIPVFEYHLIADSNSRWGRERGQFRKDLELIYQRGFRPVSISQILDRKMDLSKGLSPAVFVFDDASPSQFRYIERNGKLEIDPKSGVGIWMDFKKSHPDWGNNAVFCMLTGAAAGRSLFGDRGIEGQKSEWRFKKVQFLKEQGFELCNHTLWHAQLSKYSDAVVQEQIARGQMGIDSAVPGYKIRTFALPLGVWPKNRALAKSGSWKDPKTGKVVTYNNEAILEVSGGPTRSPYDPAFNPLSIWRVEVVGNAVEQTINALDKSGRYVSDGNPKAVARGSAK